MFSQGCGSSTTATDHFKTLGFGKAGLSGGLAAASLWCEVVSTPHRALQSPFGTSRVEIPLILVWCGAGWGGQGAWMGTKMSTGNSSAPQALPSRRGTRPEATCSVLNRTVLFSAMA